MTIAAERIRAIPWLGSDRAVRVVRIDGKLWWVAADICWVLGLQLNSNGRPNVSEALKRVDTRDRCFVRLETLRGSLKPYTRYALTTTIGMLALVERQRRQARAAPISDADLHAWIARAVAELTSRQGPGRDAAAAAGQAPARKLGR
jgi:prophage antirepressor-like protein